MQKYSWNIQTEAFSNEMKLLLLCSVKDCSIEQESKIRSIIEDNINWQLFLKIVKKHRVHPIVYKNLSKIKSTDISEKVLMDLEQLCQKNLMNSIKLTAELIKISRAMDENGIRLLSLKGPLLAMAIYGDMALRNSRDLDILIDTQDVEKTERLLFEAGYRNIELEAEEVLTPKRKQNSIKSKHHFVYINANGIITEIHWRYSYQFANTHFDKLWMNRKEQNVSGQKIAVLAPEDEFIFLVIHGAKHGWNRLRWLCDVAEIIKQDQIRWDEIIKRAEKMNILDMILQAVILSNQLYASKIPELLNKSLKGNKVGWQMAEMAIPFINEIEEGATEPGQHQYIYFKKYNYARSKGIKSKLTYLATMVYPQHVDYKTVNFSDRYFFMYYLMRPFFKIRRMIR